MVDRLSGRIITTYPEPMYSMANTKTNSENVPVRKWDVSGEMVVRKYYKGKRRREEKVGTSAKKQFSPKTEYRIGISTKERSGVNPVRYLRMVKAFPCGNFRVISTGRRAAQGGLEVAPMR
jgi:hypothetical protein